MKSICVFGVFVADLCFVANAIPEKGQTILGNNILLVQVEKDQTKQLLQLDLEVKLIL